MFPTLPEPPPGVCAVRFMPLPTMPMRLVAVLSLVAWGLVFVGVVPATAQQPAPGQRPSAAQRPAAMPAAAPQRVAAVPGQPMPQQAGQQQPGRPVPQQAGPQQPPPLTPEQQAALERLLAAWEARNAAVTTWSCTFHKWEYNAWSPADGGGERLAFSESSGEIKYAAPDKGLFRVKESTQWNPETRRYEKKTGDTGEHWVCNGTSIYEFQPQRTAAPRNATATGDAAVRRSATDRCRSSSAPRPETLKKRYSMRIITPPGVADQIWLEATPRSRPTRRTSPRSN
jgi:hypothetical protein